MNSVVFTKHPAELDTDFSNLQYKAFAFLAILHKLGHYYLRKNFQLNSEWFNFETPENYCVRSTEKPEKAIMFIVKIFGEVPLYASFYGSEYILNEANWKNRSIRIFRNEFLDKLQRAYK